MSSDLSEQCRLERRDFKAFADRAGQRLELGQRDGELRELLVQPGERQANPVMSGRDRQNPPKKEGSLDDPALLDDDVGEFGQRRDVSRGLKRAVAQQALGFRRIAGPQGRHRLIDDKG